MSGAAPAKAATSRANVILWLWRVLCTHSEAIWQRRDFIRDQARSQRYVRIVDRTLGSVWFFLAPLAELVVYFLLVAVIFQRQEFYGVPAFVAIALGLAHYWVFQRIFSRTVSVIVDNRSILLQIKIEPITFVAISFLAGLQEVKYYIIIVAFAMLAYGIVPGSSIFFYPFMLGLILIVTWAFSLLAATAYVFFRDIKELSAILMRLLLYACPIIYALQLVPDAFRDLYLFNPFATLFAMVSSVVLGFESPAMHHVIASVAFAFTALLAAHLYYEWTKRLFTKVI